MYEQTINRNIRIINVTSGAGAATLRSLIDTALGGKSAPANALPRGSITKMALTPSAAITVSDSITGDGAPVGINARVVYDVIDPLDKFSITGAATVSVELYFDKGAQ